VLFVRPRGRGRARLYLMYSLEQRRCFVGSAAPRALLQSLPLDCIPGSERIARATPAGPCAAYPMNDTCVDRPILEGLALIG
jgi:hypothetical protein